MLAVSSSGKRDSMDASTDVTSKLEAVNIQSSPSAPSTKRDLGLTSLPASVRNKIFAHLLDTELVNAGQPNVSYSHNFKDSTLDFTASRPPFPVETALFYVNKQISEESRNFFYSRNLFVKFDIYTADARHAKTMLEDSGVLFSVASQEAVERCRAHAMNLTIVEKSSALKRTSVLFPAQYLPRLINFMEQASKASGSWGPNHALFLSVLNTYGLEQAKIQGDLLELFRLLTGIGAVEVEGKDLLAGYAEGLQQSMVLPKFEADTWLAMMVEILDRAKQAQKNKDNDTAIQQAQAVIISMTYAFLTRAETLHSQPESFTKSIQRLRWQTELLVATLLHLKHSATTPTSSWRTSGPTLSPARKRAAAGLLAAETAASHALSLSNDSPSPASNPWFQSLPPELIPSNKSEWFSNEERGHSWYMLGLVHLALGEYLFAAGDLERAVGLLAGGSEDSKREEAENAFARAREGIDWEVRPGVGLRKAAWIARSEVD